MTVERPSMMDSAIQRESQNGNRKEDIRAIVEEIFSTSNMRLRAVLKPKQIYALAMAQIFAEKYDSEIMENMVEYLLEYTVSERGLGRRNLQTVMTSTLLGQQEQEQQTVKRKLLGF